MRKLALPDLALSPRPSGSVPPRSMMYGAFPVLAVAAVLLAIWVMRPSDEGQLQIKGAGVWVWYERSGEVYSFKEGDALREGDRVRAELLALAPSVGYWLVTDDAGKPIVDSKFITGSELSLAVGKRVAFTGSIRVVGNAVGETLHVVVCKEGALERGEIDQLVAAEKNALALLPARCEAKSFKLR